MLEISTEKVQKLIQKYGGAVPRYTSYPTAPEWKHEYSKPVFEEAIHLSNQSNNNYSLYLHIPFCESQCYYCACNVVISKKKSIADEYLNKLKEEIDYLGAKVSKSRKCVQMAWGGGTPTYLSPKQITDLYQHTKESFNLATDTDNLNHEFAIEIDPRVTSIEHLQTLYDLGFNRLSMGIQDFNPETQTTINRVQSFTDVSSLVTNARKIGFTSINFDLIYGLPYQTFETFEATIDNVLEINPERIALFNYAHIPSLFPFQKKYIPDDSLPNQKAKCRIFDMAASKLVADNYEFIGIDHFAKKNDTLFKAQKANKLYRNFQGYTTHDGCDLFGMGITAISDVQGVFKQNLKKLNNYYQTEVIGDAEKFMQTNTKDQARRQIIKDLMCHNEATINTYTYQTELKYLQDFVEDGLITLSTPNTKETYIKIMDLGRMFARNIASCFDEYFQSKSGHKIFSKSL